jgi:hypothetical protein
LSHYIGVLERKPRAAGQAKPVRETVAERIQAVRARLAQGPIGDREFVQILRLSLEYGQSALLAALDACQATGTVSYEAIRFQLLQQLQALPEPASGSNCLAFGPAIASTDLKAYDGLLKAGEVQ